MVAWLIFLLENFMDRTIWQAMGWIGQDWASSNKHTNNVYNIVHSGGIESNCILPMSLCALKSWRCRGIIRTSILSQHHVCKNVASKPYLFIDLFSDIKLFLSHDLNYSNKYLFLKPPFIMKFEEFHLD